MAKKVLKLKKKAPKKKATMKKAAKRIAKPKRAASAMPVVEPKRVLDSLEALRELTGQEVSLTDWFMVTQERIQQFADVTLDHQWIHVDVKRAQRESPFGAPIAHGFLTLSLLPHFMHQAVGIRNGVRMGVNYGLNRLRFVSPLRSGTKVRARFTLNSVKDVEPDGVEIVYNATVEGEDNPKPVCVAEWVVRYYR